MCGDTAGLSASGMVYEVAVEYLNYFNTITLSIIHSTGNRMTIMNYKTIEDKIVKIRNLPVLLDSSIAELYQVETKRINEAVSRNEDKFPEGYLIQLTAEEKAEVVANCDLLQSVKFSNTLPKAFTEKGLYMLATILKSPVATQTTLLIIDTFAKVRELGRVIHQVNALPENSPQQKTLMARTGDLIGELIVPEDELEVTGTETTIEMNFAIFKIKKTVKKGKS